ncbi:MAG: hypothetical protein ACUVWK_05155 [Nitrososphaerales archaeon]
MIFSKHPAPSDLITPDRIVPVDLLAANLAEKIGFRLGEWILPIEEL